MPNQESKLVNNIRVSVARYCAKFGEQWTVNAKDNVITITLDAGRKARAIEVTQPSKPEPTKEQFVDFLKGMQCGNPVLLNNDYKSRFEEFGDLVDRTCVATAFDISYDISEAGMTITRNE